MFMKKNDRVRMSLACLSAVLPLQIIISCGENSENKAYSADVDGETVIVSMVEYDRAFRNPLKGFREFFGESDPVRSEYPYPYGSMIKEYMQWNKLENTAEDGVDRIIEYSNHRWSGVDSINVKVIPRVYIVWLEPWHGGRPADPSVPDDLNGWHWPSDIPIEKSPYRQIPGSVGAYVDEQDSITVITGGYFDPSFPERVEKLVAKLGEAWDNDPRVAYVEMGIIGEWGEHHDPDISTVFPPHDEPEHVAGRTWMPGIEKVLGDAFSKAFRNKKVMVRYAYEFLDYDFGIYWDSWSIDEEIDRGYNAMINRGDYWKKQVVGGEITWNWGSLYNKGYRSLEDCLNNDSTRTLVIEQIRNLHCNHLGGVTWADFTDRDFLVNADEVQKALGYRFVMDKAEYPISISGHEPFTFGFSVSNTGSSPFYYDWPVEIALLDCEAHEKVCGRILDNVMISSWMPGENWDIASGKYLYGPQKYDIKSEVNFNADISDGRYIIAIGILDPACGRPTVRFANTNYFEGGWHPLGYVCVGTSECHPQLDASEFYDIQGDLTLNYVPDTKN